MGSGPIVMRARPRPRGCVHPKTAAMRPTVSNGKTPPSVPDRSVNANNRAPVRFRTRAQEHFGLGDGGLPRVGAEPGASRRPEVPYEDVTSTEPRLLLSNGSPPSRGLRLRWRDPTLPVPRAARAGGTARGLVRASERRRILVRAPTVVKCPPHRIAAVAAEEQRVRRKRQGRRPCGHRPHGARWYLERPRPCERSPPAAPLDHAPRRTRAPHPPRGS